jgi:hypothetical protein
LWRAKGTRSAGDRVLLCREISWIQVFIGCDEKGEEDGGGEHGDQVVCLPKRIFPARGITVGANLLFAARCG